MRKYDVYRNLHKGGYSIKDKKSGLVVGHCESLQMVDVEFVVNQNGREKVLRQKQKNVHAFARGEIVSVWQFVPYKDRSIVLHGRYPYMDIDKVWLFEVTYNPYRYNSFVLKRNSNPIYGARVLTLDRNFKLTAGVKV